MKKIISVILCVTILMSVCAVSFAYSPADALDILKSMEVMVGDPDGNMRADNLVIRSEFAKMAVLLSEYKDRVSMNSKVSVFKDCTASHWASAYVKVAAENGIIQGYSDGIFGPDDNITYTQAVTVALRLLGYKDSDFGYSYPEGQLAMALSLKLNSGVDKSDNDNLTRRDVALILTNMLSTPKKDTNTDYIKSIGYTLADDVIIVATNNENAGVAPGYVFTSNGEYKISERFDHSLVGKKGSAVINSDNMLVTLLPQDGKTVKYSVYSAGSEFVTVYSSNGLSTLNCDDGTLSYNGTNKTNFSSLRSSLSTGDVLTVGMDKNGNADYIVAGESDFEGPYTVKDDGVILSDNDYSGFTFVRNGSTSSLENIKKNDIVYISQSLKTVFSYNKKISGIYSKAIPNIDAPKSVVVGGSEYKIESSLAFSKLASGGSVSIGDTVVISLGRDGGIADVIDGGEAAGQSYAGNLLKEESGKEPYLALLGALDAIELSNGRISGADKIMTRGEFSRLAVMSSAHRNKVAKGLKISVFPDCLSDNPATPYIKVAAENGFLSAQADSLFHPDDSINLATALNACLKILGYADSDFSDWPSSQISIAASKSITNGVNKTAYDALTRDEAARIMYNTLCAYSKQGNTTGINIAGYEYHDDAVLIATNKENTSVQSGKILTSVGTFSLDNKDISEDDIGKSGQLLVRSGKLTMFNRENCYYTKNTVYSAIPGGLSVTDGKETHSFTVADDTPVYIDAAKQSFAVSKEKIGVGDTAYACYDNSRRLKYIYINSSNLKGPFSVVSASGWYSGISGAHDGSAIVKNGTRITSDELAPSDILYYSPSLDTAFVYNEKVIGILESASPSKDAPDTVRVSGTSYTLESSITSFADTNLGDTVVLCLGRNGKVAASYSASDTLLVGYLASTGSKEFTNSNGDKYTSGYASVILADGTKVDCATDSDYDGWINKIMSITFTDGKAKLNFVSQPNNIMGTFDAGNLKFGSHKLSKNIKILEVGYSEVSEPTIYTSIYPQRLDGIAVSKSDILYAKSENGVITELILRDVTGDAFNYGVITSANTNIREMSASGSYTCNIGGSSYSYSGGAYTNISKGSFVKAALSGNRIENMVKINPQIVSVKEVSYTDITLSSGQKLKLSDKVSVFKVSGGYNYTLLPLSTLTENPKAYANYTLYSDKSEASGGRVRVILVR